MRSHELWCASHYRLDGGGWMPCDCGAEAEQAKQLAPQQTGLKKDYDKRKHAEPIQWLGQLPDQFCVKCEGSPVKAVILTPKEQEKHPTRVFAACLSSECAHIRELDPSTVL